MIQPNGYSYLTAEELAEWLSAEECVSPLGEFGLALIMLGRLTRLLPLLLPRQRSELAALIETATSTIVNLVLSQLADSDGHDELVASLLALQDDVGEMAWEFGL